MKFFLSKYRYSTKRNAGNKGTWSQEELEPSTNAWATKFVQTNLRPQLESWLRELDSFFPEELPFGTCRVRKSCFTAMAVTENYQSTPHTDMDLCNSVISWFLKGECSLQLLFILNTMSLVEGEKKMIAYLLTHISSLGTRLELDRRSNIRRAICVSNAQIVFPAQARDRHTLLVCMASTLHHAHPRGRTAIGLRIVPSEANVLPIHSLTSKSVSNQLSSE